jgi:mRNA interferase ChpB
VQARGEALAGGSRVDGGSASWPRADLMERGDIYLVSLDPTAGHEQQGKRPVLVISTGKFNRQTGVPVVLPITTGGGFARTAGFAVSLMGAGLQTIGVVRCDQPRALDLKARGAKKLETVPDFVIDEVLSKVGPLFE